MEQSSDFKFIYTIPFKISACRWLLRNEPKHVAIKYDGKYILIIIAK